MTNDRRYLNNRIVECANYLRGYLRGSEKYEELNDYSDNIRTIISEYANLVYNKEEKDIVRIAIVYSEIIAVKICSFIEKYCNENDLEYTKSNNTVFIDGKMINPYDGIGNVYEALNRINRKNHIRNVFSLIKRKA